MAEISFESDYVEQQCWAYLTSVLNFPDISAAAIMGSWCNESGRTGTTPDPTSIEGIFNEPLRIGPRKQAAMNNWSAYAVQNLSKFLNQWYIGDDGKYYPGVGMWAMTGPKVTQLFRKAQKLGAQWYDLDPQLVLFKETYIDSYLDSGRRNMMSSLQQGRYDLTYLTACAYGLVAYGRPFYQPSAADSANRIYSKYSGKRFEYSGNAQSINKCEEFIQKALSYKGVTGSQWASKHQKWYHMNAWCADFVSACGEEVEISGKVFDASSSPYTCAHSVEKYGGKVHNESSYAPQRGDLVNFMWDGGSIESGHADHIGIVVKYENSIVYTVEGNTSNKVAERSYPRSSSVLACFCSPDWSKVGGSTTSAYGTASGSSISGVLFDESCTRKDATLRESAYLETIYTLDKKTNARVVKEYKATAKKTDIKLSLINYTDLFQAFWDSGVSSLGSSSNAATSSYDYSKLNARVRVVVQYLADKGLNNAAACGICGNIKHESSFSTGAIGDNGTSFGICQWHNKRGSAMKQMAGPDWANNLSGQLDYLWWELENDYGSLLQALKIVENVESGCKHAADLFVRQFERPANVDFQSEKRQISAAEYFNQITQIVLPSVSSSQEYNSVNYANLASGRQADVSRAYEEQGKPYVWAATGPDAYDCSGLVGYCLTGSHERLYTTGTMQNWPHTSNPVPGDVCLSSGHTGLYIGDGKMIHAPQSGDVVKISPVQSDMWYCIYPNFQQ